MVQALHRPIRWDRHVHDHRHRARGRDRRRWGPADEWLGRRDQGVTIELQQRLAIGSQDRNRGQGDRRGEPVGHQQVVFQVVDPVAPGHAQRIVRCRDDDGGRLHARGGRGDRGCVLSLSARWIRCTTGGQVLPGVRVAYAFHHLANGLDDQFGLLDLDVVPARGGDDVSRTRHQRGQLVLQLLPHRLERVPRKVRRQH